jgi:hypothetical protein
MALGKKAKFGIAAYAQYRLVNAHGTGFAGLVAPQVLGHLRWKLRARSLEGTA